MNIPNKSIIISNHPYMGDLMVLIVYLRLFYGCKNKKIYVLANDFGIKFKILVRIFRITLIYNKHLKKAMKLLNNGNLIIMFPEGHLSKKSNKIYPGFIWLAKTTKSNIYLFKINNIKIRFIKMLSYKLSKNRLLNIAKREILCR